MKSSSSANANDLVEALADVRALQPEDRAVEEDVLASGEFGMEARAELEQRAIRTADIDVTFGRFDDARDDPQQRALARAVPSDEASVPPGSTWKEDVTEAQTSAGLVRAAQQYAALQRTRAARIDAEATRELADANLTRAHESPAPARRAR
jgi:hypothetical protein